MSDFVPSNAPLGSLDPGKRVRYTTGLVLGVDEFLQEELYFLEKNRLHNRSLHGYGTVCGLDVTVEQRAGSEPEILVSAGLAVDPQGREIRVPQSQCARLDDWLLRHRSEIENRLGSPALPTSPLQIPLYVVLCYRECETDRVPIPSGPCQSFDQVSAPSRIADDFELSIRLEAPSQVEEEAIRAFGALLAQIEIGSGPGPFLTLDELQDLVRDLIASGSPAIVSAPVLGSPSALRLDPNDASELLRAAFRVWVTEVRPRLLPEGRNCSSGPPSEGCILLARLDTPLEEIIGGFRSAGLPSIDQSLRPYLLQTRMLQEWLLNNRWINVHGDLEGLIADDHPQYLLVDPASRALIDDLDAGGNRVVALAQALNPGEAVPFEQAIKVSDPASADLDGTYPSPSVVGLQGRPVAGTAPNADDVLTWDGDASPPVWTPRPLPPATLSGPAGGDLNGNYPNPLVDGLQGRPVSAQAPVLNDVLTWNGTNWIPRLVPVLQRNLTRITNLSWRHGTLSTFRFSLNSPPPVGTAIVNGVVIGFSNLVEVRPGSADENSFQAFIELPASFNDSFSPFIPIVRIPVREVIPVQDLVIDPSGLITTATRVEGNTRGLGAALIFQSDAVARLLQIAQPPWIHVLLRGDVVIDRNGNAVDCEFVRATLPTGDRPPISGLGIQGGRFESWARFRRPGPFVPGFPLDINFAAAEDLLELPGINLAIANAIIERRNTRGRFTTVEELASVTGIGAARLNSIRRLIAAPNAENLP